MLVFAQLANAVYDIFQINRDALLYAGAIGNMQGAGAVMHDRRVHSGQGFLFHRGGNQGLTGGGIIAGGHIPGIAFGLLGIVIIGILDFGVEIAVFKDVGSDFRDGSRRPVVGNEPERHVVDGIPAVIGRLRPTFRGERQEIELGPG